MAGPIDALIQKVTGDDIVPIIPGLLRPIDTHALARKLKLEALGAERGAQELPHSNELTPDAVEQSVIQTVTSEWQWNCNELGKMLKAYADRLNEYSVKTEAESLRVRAKNARARLLNANTAADAQLGPLKEAFLAARTELKDFKDRHRISRPARNGSRRWTTVGLLILFIGVESIFNGFFFEKGSETGLLGGIFTAIGISIVNIVFAFLVGLIPARYANHKSFVIRYPMAILTVFFAFSLVALHAFAAHLRDIAAAGEPANNVALAVKNLIESPWSLNDLNSYYLFGLGILLAILSFWKGLTFDDPYPGYGPVSRRLRDAREDYSDEHLGLFGELEDEKEDAVAQLLTGIKNIPVYFHRADQIRSGRRSLVEAIRNYEPALEAAANQLLKIYRDKNRANRKTSPPSHFNTQWKLPHRYVDTTDFVGLTAEGETITKAEVDAILLELRPLADDLLSLYEKLIERYPHPTNME